MKRTSLLAVVLCLAAAAMLVIAAAPALAQTGCDCHTAVPPTNGAPAAHAPFVASVTDCTTCHVDWVVPHPESLSWPSVLALSGRSTDVGYRVHGWLGVHIGGLTPVTKPHPGVAVYLQQRLWGATDWTDLTQVTTGAKGRFGFTVASPPPYAAYRAVSQGHIGVSLFSDATALFRPRTTTLLPTPDLTIAIRGFMTGGLQPQAVKLGRTLTVHGVVAPVDVGGKVTIRVQKRVNHKWVTRVTVKRAISGTGTYRWKWTPQTRGAFRVDAWIPTTVAHEGVVKRWALGPWPTFYVY
jgi:hypothetical protein